MGHLVNEFMKGDALLQDAYSIQIKSILENIINEMSTHPELFAKNPGKDFTRDRKLSFNKFVQLMLNLMTLSLFN